jgi:spore germination cell wall hydrolase CwlJ-like protein
MLTSLRSAMVICATLATISVAPAQADPTPEPLIAATSASLPQVRVPDLLDPSGEPELSQPVQPANQPDSDILVSQSPPSKITATGDLGDMVAQLKAATPGTRELECLATGIYFESKSEPLLGQLAVGKVIVNRAKSGGRFPSSYCGVLFQRGQFSFIRGRSLPSAPRAGRQWQTAVAIARIVDSGLKASAAESALFFHARYVSPGWRLKRIAMIGNHIFYR